MGHAHVYEIIPNIVCNWHCMSCYSARVHSTAVCQCDSSWLAGWPEYHNDIDCLARSPEHAAVHPVAGRIMDDAWEFAPIGQQRAGLS